MPRKQMLSDLEIKELIKIPETDEELIINYSLSENDFSIIKNHCRTNTNKLRFVINLSYMRHPGIVLAPDLYPDQKILQFMGSQLGINVLEGGNYGKREQTRRDHISILRLLVCC
ncbi:DUF4158 domain-containing protein [Chryseobacterium potabilaquae]|uniref:DUF4158 domain-containing protein n=1 Tax=Chryseobacterium potabilaquae TaxID=2675057 RepID=A0A6N4X8X9_9FLAO|nr:DUF4158 domain-containing protein [Chryseobacterium potabilaquae]CAA7196693.1 hypothetical protein CHRY9293_02769 [Chryseobacterium potabilaquae]